MIRRTMLACLFLAACSPERQPDQPQPQGQEAAQAQEGVREQELQVTTPTPGARVTSPLRVEGSAPGPWYFEAVLPASIVIGGEVIAEAPAQAQGDWMTTERVPFVAELVFDVASETAAELVLTEDMPKHDASGEELPLREVRIPLTLLPSPAGSTP